MPLVAGDALKRIEIGQPAIARSSARELHWPSAVNATRSLGHCAEHDLIPSGTRGPCLWVFHSPLTLGDCRSDLGRGLFALSDCPHSFQPSPGGSNPMLPVGTSHFPIIESRKDNKAAKTALHVCARVRFPQKQTPSRIRARGSTSCCLNLYALRAASGCRGMGDAVRIEPIKSKIGSETDCA
jgi:hypothetical protein